MATVPAHAAVVRLCVRGRGDARVRLVAWCSGRRTARRDGVDVEEQLVWRVGPRSGASGPAVDSRSRARHHGFWEAAGPARGGVATSTSKRHRRGNGVFDG